MKVSIIVPVYNSESTLSRCVDSIINQTYKDIEILLVDDGSKDSSFKICQEFSKKDTRVIAYSKPNGGSASARNYGLELATGEFIQFVDSDDYIASDMTEKMLVRLQKESTDIVICGVNVISLKREKKISFGDYYCKDKTEFLDVLINHYKDAIVNSCCNKLYKKNKIFEKMPENRAIGEDYLFNLNYIANATSISLVDEALYFYDCTNESVTRGKYKNKSEHIEEMYVNSFEIFNKLYSSDELNSVVAQLFIKDLLYDYVNTKTLFGIKTRELRKILNDHDKYICFIHSNEKFYLTIKNRKYFKLCLILKKRKLAIWSKKTLKKMFWKMCYAKLKKGT